VGLCAFSGCKRGPTASSRLDWLKGEQAQPSARLGSGPAAKSNFIHGAATSCGGRGLN
jgi:hypothetical protein